MPNARTYTTPLLKRALSAMYVHTADATALLPTPSSPISIIVNISNGDDDVDDVDDDGGYIIPISVTSLLECSVVMTRYISTSRPSKSGGGDGQHWVSLS